MLTWTGKICPNATPALVKANDAVPEGVESEERRKAASIFRHFRLERDMCTPVKTTKVANAARLTVCI